MDKWLYYITTGTDVIVCACDCENCQYKVMLIKQEDVQYHVHYITDCCIGKTIYVQYNVVLLFVLCDDVLGITPSLSPTH